MISLMTRPPMRRSVSLSCSACKKPSASRTLISVKSLMLRSPSVTARLVGLSRAPLQSGHGLSAMYSSIFWRTCSDSVSAKRRCRCLRMPWKLAV